MSSCSICDKILTINFYGVELCWSCRLARRSARAFRIAARLARRLTFSILRLLRSFRSSSVSACGMDKGPSGETGASDVAGGPVGLSSFVSRALLSFSGSLLLGGGTGCGGGMIGSLIRRRF